MFDVIWTDPNRELMGEKMHRKEKEREAKEKERMKSESGRQSVSTTGSSSSERGFSLFASKSRNKLATPSKSTKMPLSATSPASDSSKYAGSLVLGVQSLLLRENGSDSTEIPGNGVVAPASSPEPGDVRSIQSPRGK
jgi:hypothetical protein